jgi:predicted N-formylglutamate amidohydrolase
VPGNIGLSERHQLARVREIFRPYHDRIVTETRSATRSRPPDSPDFRAQLHTRFQDLARLWHVGVLYNRDPRFAQILMELLHREEGLVLGDNEPYSVTDASDYTIPVHGEQRDLHHVALEICQDLITDEAGQRKLAALFVRLLPQAYERPNSLQIPK